MRLQIREMQITMLITTDREARTCDDDREMDGVDAGGKILDNSCAVEA